jgi:subtilisin family serine protease
VPRRPFLLLALVAAAAAIGGLAVAAPAAAADVDVVVELRGPSLTTAVTSSRVFTAAEKRRRLNLSSPTSTAYLRTLASAQRSFQAAMGRELPAADVRWRYGVVLNGLAVTVPAGQVGRLAALPGVARVYPSIRYRSRLDETPRRIGAPALWNARPSFAGDGVKIAILDDGIDQTHPFFDTRGYAMPPGFPRGQTAYTTRKVIAARAFPPRRPAWLHKARPFDPVHSGHGTHVAGIAAGNAGTPARGRLVSGVAPRAYLGNYKVLTVPTESGLGLNGNSPEIAAGIEAAVRDGMDVINLSIGEPEIEPSRDLVVRAIQGAVAAGVVVAVAAGNDYQFFGAGSVASPGSAPDAITVGAASGAAAIATFSSSGPTPLSLQLKPELSAPGVNVLSSVPARVGRWAPFSGTSMAAPHVAGAAALLRQRRPDWTPAQVKAALVLTARPLGTVSAARSGAGLVDLAAAAEPLVFAAPASVSFGQVNRTAARSVRLDDAGGGAGEWAVTIEPPSPDPAVRVGAPATVAVPGELTLSATVGAGATVRSQSGWIVLRRGETARRIPYWLGTSARRLSGHAPTPLTRTGTYRSDTSRGRALVATYRYPENPGLAGVATRLDGPEQVFRVRITRPVANFGVAVIAQARGVQIEPRVVAAGDESRLIGYTGLPLDLNPYRASFGEPRPIVGAVRPAPGEYDVVFDTGSAAVAGAFHFRFWINDTTPPRLRLLTPAVARNRPVRISAVDTGSGVDAQSIIARIGGLRRRATFGAGVVNVNTQGLRPGRYRLVLRVSDRQETRNMENVPTILPNTARLETFVTVR